MSDITLRGEITSIGSSAFAGCHNVKSVTLPDCVINIGSSAFAGCTKLESITIPRGITDIKMDVFYGCSSLSNVTIPISVTRIRDGAFTDIAKHIDVYYEGTKNKWEMILGRTHGSEGDVDYSGLEYDDENCKYDADNDMDIAWNGEININTHFNCDLLKGEILDSYIIIAQNKQEYKKNFKDEEFALEGITKIGDGTLLYTVTSGNDVVDVSTSGIVTFKNV